MASAPAPTPGAASPAPGRRLSWGAVILGLLLMAALIFPYLFRLPYHRDVVIKLYLYAMLAQAWNILAGYCGQISLGHAVFFGAGGFTVLGVNALLTIPRAKVCRGGSVVPSVLPTRSGRSLSKLPRRCDDHVFQSLKAAEQSA